MIDRGATKHEKLGQNVEAMGHALAALSERLRWSGFLDHPENRIAYEYVVKAWDQF